MRRNYLLYLEDILESTDKIQNYAGDLSYEDILQDKMRIDAIVRNFEIIGEASGKIPQEVRDKFPSVEWKKISNFRNILAHEYFGIKYKIMWDIIKNKLPQLEKQIKAIVEQEKSNPQ